MTDKFPQSQNLQQIFEDDSNEELYDRSCELLTEFRPPEKFGEDEDSEEMYNILGEFIRRLELKKNVYGFTASEMHEQYKKGYKEGFDAGVEDTKLDIGKDFSRY